ncbi:MAG: 23S rRNA (pseudouridine(1915)-N(3))-methyltransferase RlmH [Betaproteobacteria bacterium]|nr:23S rRNA (pseudouridine(1915)-N(3))-methyltransferase RlmH [Betaproteobacteria bacterium]
MRLTIISVGHKMPAWIQSGYREYVKRLPPEMKVELVELKPEDRTSGKTVDKAKALEGERILAAIPEGATVLALDEKGRIVTTPGLSVMLTGWMREGVHPVFVIGGADGLSEGVIERADKLVSLSAMTLPHGLARVILAEQLYRAWSILANHPYHRE